MDEKNDEMNINLQDMRTMLIDVEHVGTGVVVGVVGPEGSPVQDEKILPTLMYALAFAARERGFRMDRFGDAMKDFLVKVGEGLDLQEANKVIN